MNVEEHLLVCLGEEASEIVKDAAKALRFGTDDRYSGGTTNGQRMVAELNDLMAVVSMLVSRRILPKDWQSADAQSAKIKRVEQFMDYARKQGALRQ